MSRQMTVAAMPVFGTFRLQLRYRLVGFSAIGLVLIAATMTESLSAYNTAYQDFQNIVLSDKIKIEDSDSALQAIAQVSTDAADSVITQSTDQAKSHAAAIAIDADFDTFRGALFKVKTNLTSASAASDTFNMAEQAVYDKFWPHLSAMLAAEDRNDAKTVTQEYAAADDILERVVSPILTSVAEYNFADMQHTEQDARRAIMAQLVILIGLTVVSLTMITVLSFCLRTRIRRLFTPGIDIAAGLCWLCGIVIISDLIQTPGELKSMVEDSYYSISATQRILALATQANRTESAEVLDVTNASKWQQLFDQNDMLIEQAVCGYNGCTDQPFNRINQNAIDPVIVERANSDMPRNSSAVVPVVPLVANVTYLGEPQAIEQIRETYQSYLTIDKQIRSFVSQNLLSSATALDTGNSDVAFGKFVAVVKLEQQINAAQFDGVWQSIQNTLPVHRILFGVISFGLVMIGLGAGVYQRYREL